MTGSCCVTGYENEKQNELACENECGTSNESETSCARNEYRTKQNGTLTASECTTSNGYVSARGCTSAVVV